MRKHALLPVLLAACSAGGPGAAGPAGGAAAPCSAVAHDGGWTITCPDGTSAEVARGGCTESDGPEGSRIIRCDDGTEATVSPPETMGEGVVIGRVALESRGATAGVRVEVVGTALATTSAADGTFRLDGVAPGTWDVRLSLAPYQPLTLSRVVVLEGTRDLGTVELALGHELPDDDENAGDLPLQRESQLLVTPGYPKTVLDLATSERYALQPPPMGWVSDASWLDAETLLVSGVVDDRVLPGIWTRAGGIRWYPGLTDWDATAGGILATRTGDDGSAALWFLSGDSRQRLDLDPDAGRWNLGGTPRWIVSSAAGTFLVDGTGGTAEVTSILDRAVVDVTTDPTSGDLVVLGFPWEQWAYDTVHHISFVADADARIELRDGVASWRLADGRFVSWDSQAGTSIYRDAGLEVGWSPQHRWLWDGPTDGAYQATSRNGGTVTALGDAPPESFSPDERSAAVFGEDFLRLIDLETGAIAELATHTEYCQWIDDGAIACSTGEELVRAEVDGTVRSLGQVQSWWVEDGGLFYETDYRLWFASADGSSIDLGSPQRVALDPTRQRLVWVSGADNLYVRSLTTGETIRIGEGVNGIPLPLRDVVLYDARDRYTGATSIRYAPYP